MNANLRGFTVLELLIVMSMIVVLATVILASLNNARKKGKITTAQSQIEEINKAASLAYIDTGSFLGITEDYCNPSTFGSGGNSPIGDSNIIVKSTGDASWKGPYINSVPKDPWGVEYWFNRRFYCKSEDYGCEQYVDQVVGVIGSCGEAGKPPPTPGEHGVKCYHTTPQIVKVLCLGEF